MKLLLLKVSNSDVTAGGGGGYGIMVEAAFVCFLFCFAKLFQIL